MKLNVYLKLQQKYMKTSNLDYGFKNHLTRFFEAILQRHWAMCL